MEKTDYETKKLAKCFIVPLSKEIKIPQDIFASLKPLGKNIVAVIPGESKKITFFLTNAQEILFVKLILDKSSLNEKFFTSLRNTLRELEIENLFSTGVCFRDEICVWEGVFEFDQQDDNFDEVQKKLSNVMHVNNAKFEKLHVQNQ